MFFRKPTVTFSIFICMLAVGISAAVAGVTNRGSIVISGPTDFNMDISADTSVTADYSGPTTDSSSYFFFSGIDKSGTGKAVITVQPNVSFDVTASSNDANVIYGLTNAGESSDISILGNASFSASTSADRAVVRGVHTRSAGTTLLSGDITVSAFGKSPFYSLIPTKKIYLWHRGVETRNTGKTIFYGRFTDINVKTDGGGADAVSTQANAANAYAYTGLNAEKTSIFMEGVNLQKDIPYASKDTVEKPVENLYGINSATSGDNIKSVADINGALDITISADNYFNCNGSRIGNNVAVMAHGTGAAVNINGDIDITVRSIDYGVVARYNGLININEGGRHSVKIDGVVQASQNGQLNVTIKDDTSFMCIAAGTGAQAKLKSLNGAAYMAGEFDLQSGGDAVICANTTLSADRLLVSGEENTLTVESGGKVYIGSIMTEDYGEAVEGSLTVYADYADRANIVIPESPNLKVEYLPRTQDGGSSGGCSTGACPLMLLLLASGACLYPIRRKR